MDSIRLMAEGVRLLATREDVMRAFAAEDWESLARHYYAYALQKGLSKAYLLGNEALDLVQEVALKIHSRLVAWRNGKSQLPRSKFLSFWVEVEADRAVREWFYRNRGWGYTSARLVAKVTRLHDGGLTPEEIAEKLGVPVEAVQEALAMAQAEAILSLDDTNDNGTPYRDLVATDSEEDDAFYALEEAIEKYRLREKLGEAEAKLLDRFLSGEDLGEELLSHLEAKLAEAMQKSAAAAA
ncbi:MAG: sigma-70 domain-containing protein [Thermus sp.]|nr:sigma-70 domain-containing protein [Thermus sp.]